METERASSQPQGGGGLFEHLRYFVSDVIAGDPGW